MRKSKPSSKKRRKGRIDDSSDEEVLESNKETWRRLREDVAEKEDGEQEPQTAAKASSADPLGFNLKRSSVTSRRAEEDDSDEAARKGEEGRKRRGGRLTQGGRKRAHVSREDGEEDDEDGDDADMDKEESSNQPPAAAAAAMPVDMDQEEDEADDRGDRRRRGRGGGRKRAKSKPPARRQRREDPDNEEDDEDEEDDLQVAMAMSLSEMQDSDGQPKPSSSAAAAAAAAEALPPPPPPAAPLGARPQRTDNNQEDDGGAEESDEDGGMDWNDEYSRFVDFWSELEEECQEAIEKGRITVSHLRPHAKQIRQMLQAAKKHRSRKASIFPVSSPEAPFLPPCPTRQPRKSSPPPSASATAAAAGRPSFRRSSAMAADLSVLDTDEYKFDFGPYKDKYFREVWTLSDEEMGVEAKYDSAGKGFVKWMMKKNSPSGPMGKAMRNFTAWYKEWVELSGEMEDRELVTLMNKGKQHLQQGIVCPSYWSTMGDRKDSKVWVKDEVLLSSIPEAIKGTVLHCTCPGSHLCRDAEIFGVHPPH
ncbi:unnamed protein product [Vitrella brassicaformis CCMP3155]|uniref:Uncharacterized protein n=3 Tax=Vitrella brassicaformis TaxID=1169539 RepID=A0A0G4EY62_VITBC|nr:unnamed protein product [Vitrella brassicaformis CCMP3155]|eukprot:CEM04060.1 unnamed protein product [Vitrella brassicaformis CCMP3155]